MFKHRILQLSEETVASLQSIWKEAGYEDAECHRLLGDIFDKLKACCTAEIAAEQHILDHAMIEVESKTEEYKRFCHQLGRSFSIAHLDNCNTNIKLSDLDKRVSDMFEVVSLRETEINNELSGIRDLVTSLNESFPGMDIFSGPEGTPELSDIRLTLMKQYKAELEGIKQQRTSDLLVVLNECKQHITDLVLEEEGFKTMEDNETFASCDEKLQDWISEGELTFGYSKADMTELQTRVKALVHEKEKRKEELTGIGAEIAALWTLLRVPPEVHIPSIPLYTLYTFIYPLFPFIHPLHRPLPIP